MHGSLPNEDQLKVFQRPPLGTRKVVVATNVAEASVTIPGIVYGKILIILVRNKKIFHISNLFVKLLIAGS
jgi:hypothetical protein